MPHRKVHFSVFLVSRSILLCSFKCLSLVLFFGIVYISASFVVSIFLSLENIIDYLFSNDNETMFEQPLKMFERKKAYKAEKLCTLYFCEKH